MVSSRVKVEARGTIESGLTGELFSVDGLSSGSVVAGEVSSLEHEP